MAVCRGSSSATRRAGRPSDGASPGSAANAADGSVECVFEGPADAVEALIAFVRAGPGHAEVTSVDVTEEEPEGLDGFRTS